MSRTLINLGFMTAKLGPHDTAEAVKAVFNGIKALEDVACRATVLLSGLRRGDCVDFSPLTNLCCPTEIIAIGERTTTSVERHRLLGAGFLEQAGLVLVTDLDFGHTSGSVVELIKLGLGSPSSVFFPQKEETEHGSRSLTIGELARAFENYVTARACGKAFKTAKSQPYPNFQTGLVLLRAEAVRNLMRRPWIWQCSVWDLEVAYFTLCGHDSESFSVEFPFLPLTLIAPEFNASESNKKIEIISRLSGRLGSEAAKICFEEFIKRYSHLLSTEVVDNYRMNVVEKL